MEHTTGTLAWYYGTTALLAVLLHFPIHKLIWVLRVRRMERKLERPVTEEEREDAKRRTRILAGVIAITVAFLYNRTLSMP